MQRQPCWILRGPIIFLATFHCWHTCRIPWDINLPCLPALCHVLFFTLLMAPCNHGEIHLIPTAYILFVPPCFSCRELQHHVIQGSLNMPALPFTPKGTCYLRTLVNLFLKASHLSALPINLIDSPNQPLQIPAKCFQNWPNLGP